MRRQVFPLDASSYQQHEIHACERQWAETNCYVDVWIELLNAWGFEPIAALPLQIYVYALSPYDEWHRLAWAGALVLIVLIVVSVALVRYVAGRGVLKGAS